ncbi:molybdenum cofactor biosynthesis protein MoaE [Desulfobotulus sp. H1]|uniref:Molybdopterin synthase catalytic subunit n=1 Tax=Desulfobotulus pelophilus TaxID=2823377 RepID=A0ABT3NB97_9BACT|nr:molybdenum cofactor biosynthesis protein MoaE [Desulfobotulus pelophilus]MCW7754695.1 molybdenum cofactor biosynthesis protein MoaE [Desulfobotulus pelophilus]
MTLSLQDLLNEIKKNPRFPQAGMVLCHNGVVRETSRDGRKVTGLRVSVDSSRLAEIIHKAKAMPGILDVLVHIFKDKPLKVGDDVMYIVVAGDIREHVIHALTSTLESIKKEATQKTEFF